jgi:hypothetical protein
VAGCPVGTVVRSGDGAGDQTGGFVSHPALSVDTSLLNHRQGSPPACFVQEVDDGAGNKSYAVAE